MCSHCAALAFWGAQSPDPLLGSGSEAQDTWEPKQSVNEKQENC